MSFFQHRPRTSQGFGFSFDAAKSIVFVGDEHISLPVGNHVCRVNIDTREQRFLAATRLVAQVTAVATYLPRDLLVVCEAHVAPRPSRVTFLNLSTGEVIGSLAPPSRRSIVSCAFSPSGKALVVQGSAPLHTLAFIRTETQQALCWRDFDHPVHHVAFNPDDDAMVCVAGHRCLRMARREGKEIHMLEMVMPEYENAFNFTEVLWINSEFLAAATSSGKVLVIEEGVLRQIIDCCPSNMHGYVVAPFLIMCMTFEWSVMCEFNRRMIRVLHVVCACLILRAG